jgi:hypothetical protein
LKFGQGITYKVLGMIEQTDKSHEQIVEEAEQTIRNEVEG